MTVLGAAPAPAGGIDLDLPGDEIRMGATRWPGAGPPVVLLHGLASQRRFWNLVVPHLVTPAGAGLPVLAVDQRGHGDADRPESSYDLGQLAADLATAMDAVGWSRAVIVGHSWGGAVAATFAADHPERTLAVVGIDGGTSPPVPAGQDRSEIRKRLQPPQLAMPPAELEARIRSRAPNGSTSTDEVAAAVLPIFEVGADGLARARLPFDIHMQIVDTLLDYDAPATLARVRAPMWFVACGWPGDDAEQRGRAEAYDALARSLPQARFMRWGGAIHDVPLQWPALVAGLIRTVTDEVRPTT
jgi:pimeloyl-ACP methyl ester carboxylesterase